MFVYLPSFTGGLNAEVFFCMPHLRVKCGSEPILVKVITLSPFFSPLPSFWLLFSP